MLKRARQKNLVLVLDQTIGFRNNFQEFPFEGAPDPRASST